MALAVVAVLAVGVCGPGISDGPSPQPITDAELRTWVTTGATLGQVENSLRRRKPYSVHERGSQTWAMNLDYVETEPGLRDRAAIKQAMEKYPTLLLHATRAETTCVFFDAAGVAKEFYRMPNSTEGAVSTGARVEKGQQ